MKISTVEEMRGLDAWAMKEYGVPDYLLMENAGGAVYFVIHRELSVPGRHFLVVSGPGNNGGDGFVVGRKLHSTGGKVRSFLLSDPSSYSGPARTNLEILQRSGVEIVVQPSTEEIARSLTWCDAVVDGLLGTGIKGEVGGRFREIIQQINDSGKPVFSIDIPSGVDGDTGQVRGVAIRASQTITFGLPKRGNLIGPGAELGGRLFVSHISFPPKLIATADIKVAISAPVMLPPPHGEGVTESLGDVLFVAGAKNPVDSTAFASMALAEIAGSPARFAIPRSLVSSVESLAGKVVVMPQDETNAGTLALSCLDELLDLSQAASLVILGPGLSPSEETRELTRRICEHLEKPLLLSGDALVGGFEDLGVIRRRTGSTVLVLQPSDMSRLTERTLAEMQTDPLASVQDLCEDLGAIVVLWGKPALMGLPDRRVYVDVTDRFLGFHEGWCNVLPGAIGAMCELGLPLEEAVQTGVFLRGLAGDLAARERGEDRVTARQIVQALPSAIKAFREDYLGISTNFHGAIEVI
jgi:NAD(P)H-hydrate epimerase